MIHDFLLRIISTYLRDNDSCDDNDSYDNNDIVKLMSLNQRFYSIRYIFIKQLRLNALQSEYAYTHKPYNWNKVHSMMFYDSNISDVSALGTCHSLELYNCRNIRDVSALGKCHYLKLLFLNISDVSALGTCHHLELRYCENISEVSALGKCYSLVLHSCQKISDVSALKDVPNLQIIIIFEY